VAGDSARATNKDAGLAFAQLTPRHLSIAYSSCEGFRSGYNSTIGLMTFNKIDPIDRPIIRLYFRNSSSEQNGLYLGEDRILLRSMLDHQIDGLLRRFLLAIDLA
jgi:hypothetical protein